jgi:hypothetical protein
MEPIQTKKPRVLLKNLSEEERLQRIADSVQARRDYIKEYYKKSEPYRTACKARARVFAKNYYHNNSEYKEKVKLRSQLISKLNRLSLNEVSVEYLSTLLNDESEELADPQNP